MQQFAPQQPHYQAAGVAPVGYVSSQGMGEAASVPIGQQQQQQQQGQQQGGGFVVVRPIADASGLPPPPAYE